MHTYSYDLVERSCGNDFWKTGSGLVPQYSSCSAIAHDSLPASIPFNLQHSKAIS